MESAAFQIQAVKLYCKVTIKIQYFNPFGTEENNDGQQHWKVRYTLHSLIAVSVCSFSFISFAWFAMSKSYLFLLFILSKNIIRQNREIA